MPDPWWSKETKILYDTAGYSVTIPRESDASSDFLQNLESANWIDSKTRAVFVEYGVYNANVDHFAVARHAFEIAPSGLVLPTETFDSVPLLADVRILMGDNPKPENIAQVFFEFTLYAVRANAFQYTINSFILYALFNGQIDDPRILYTSSGHCN